MLSGGVDVKTVQEVLGHENLNTTQIYTHVASSQVRSAMDSSPLSNVTADKVKRSKKKNSESSKQNDPDNDE